jgi:putative chitinase
MKYLEAQQIAAVTKASLENVEAVWPLVCNALEVLDINTPLVQVGMAATIAIETKNFLPEKEKLAKPTESVYVKQIKYYNTGFYGRGFIQLTWQKNYAAAGKALGIDLVGNPDLALDPAIAAKIAAWFFVDKGIQYECNRRDWPMVRRMVNGPNYRLHNWERFKGFCDQLAKAVQQ